MSDTKRTKPNIHINSEPPEDTSGRLHTVIAKEHDYLSFAWIEDTGKAEAWIYDAAVGRVISWVTYCT